MISTTTEKPKRKRFVTKSEQICRGFRSDDIRSDRPRRSVRGLDNTIAFWESFFTHIFDYIKLESYSAIFQINSDMLIGISAANRATFSCSSSLAKHCREFCRLNSKYGTRSTCKPGFHALKISWRIIKASRYYVPPISSFTSYHSNLFCFA